MYAVPPPPPGARKLTKQMSSPPKDKKPAYMEDMDAMYNYYHSRIRQDFGQINFPNDADTATGGDGFGKRQQLHIGNDFSAAHLHSHLSSSPGQARNYKSARLARSRSATEQQQQQKSSAEQTIAQTRTVFAQQAAEARALKGRTRAQLVAHINAATAGNANSNASAANFLQPSPSDVVQKSQHLESFLKDSFASLNLSTETAAMPTKTASATGAPDVTTSSSSTATQPVALNATQNNNQWINFKNVDPSIFASSTANPVFSATLQSPDVASPGNGGAPAQSDSASTIASNQALNNQKYKKRSRHIRRKQNQKMHNMRMSQQQPHDNNSAPSDAPRADVIKPPEGERDKSAKRKQARAPVIEQVAEENVKARNKNTGTRIQQQPHQQQVTPSQEDDEQKMKSGRQTRAAMRRQRQKAKRRNTTSATTPTGSDVTSGESAVSPDDARKATSDVMGTVQTIQL